MRNLWLALLVTGIVGCATDGVSFEHRGTLFQDTRGVVLYEDGESGLAGMFGTTCEFETSTGGVGTDWDFPTEQEEVQDAYTGVSLTRSDVGVHLLHGENWAVDSDVEMTGVREARLIDDGVVALRQDRGGCVVEWHTGGDVTSTDVEPGWCGASTELAVDREDGTTWLATGSDLVLVAPDASEILDGGVNLVEWDPVAAVLYTATLGQTSVIALEAEGSVRWIAEVDGPIRSIESLGELGAASVMIETPSGGSFVALDGLTGEQLGTLATPEAAELVVSGDGSVLGVVLTGEVHFYDVRQGRRGLRVHTSSTEEAPEPALAD